MENEIWKEIDWFDGLYEVSNLWNIRSFKNWRFWKKKIPKILKKSVSKWYNIVNLNSKTFRIHILVANSFIRNYYNKPYVLHKIEHKPSIDSVNNLFWGTQKENMEDMKNKWRSWNLWKIWKYHHQSKSVIQLSKEWEFIKIWDSISDIGRWLWIDNWHISLVCKWKRKSAWWFKFIYG